MVVNYIYQKISSVIFVQCFNPLPKLMLIMQMLDLTSTW